MVKIDNNFNPHQTQTSQTETCGLDNQHHQPPNNQNQGSQPFSKPTTGLFSLPPAVMNIVP